MKLYPTLKATGSAIEGINAVASGAGGSLDALSNIFSLLSTKQMSVIKNIGKLTKEQMLEVIASEALTAQQKAYIQTAWQSAQATTAQAAATGGATVATGGLAAAMKGLRAVMKAHPLFMTIVGIAAVVAIFNKLNVSAKEQKAITEELQGEYQSLTSEISSLESELDGVHKRLKELDALAKSGQITPDQTKELEQLKAQNDELERNLRIQQTLAELKQTELEKSAVSEYGKTTYHHPGQLVGSLNGAEAINKYIQELESIEERQNEIIAEQDAILSKPAMTDADEATFLEHQNALDSLQKKYDQYKSKLTEIATSLQAQRENIHGVTEEGATLQLVIDEVLDSLVKFTSTGAADAVEEVGEAAEEAADSIQNLTQSLSALTDEYELLDAAQKEFEESGVLTADTLAKMAEKYPSLVNSIDQYIMGLKSGKELLSELSGLYQQDRDAFVNALVEKANKSAEFYNALSSNEQARIKMLAGSYADDLENFKTIEGKKLAYQAKVLQAASYNTKKFTATSIEGLRAQLAGFGKGANPSNMAYVTAQSEALTKAIQQIDAFNKGLDDIVAGNLITSVDKIVTASVSPKSSSSSSKSGSSSKNTETVNTTLDEIYADLKELETETGRRTDRLAAQTADTTAAQMKLWLELRKKAVAELNKITDHTSAAYRYIEDIVTSTNDKLDKLYDTQLDSIDSIIDMTKDMIKQQADDMVDALEEEKDALQDIIDLRKKLLEQASDESDYEKEVAKRVKEIADLQSSISQLDLEIKTNPNDSRAAQAERQKLLQELNEKQTELADFQAQHWKDATLDALDEAGDAFKDSKDEEIDIIKDSVDSERKLYEKAIQYIEDNWDDLYNQLIAWNKDYGSGIDSDVTLAWENAKAAVDEYGGSIEAAIEKLNYMKSLIQSGTENGSYAQVDELTTNSALMDIVKAMKKNSEDYLLTKDAAERAKIKQSQADLVQKFQDTSGHTLVQGSDGTWYLDKLGGTTVYSHFGVGDIVRNDPSTQSGSVTASNPYKQPSGTLKQGSTAAGVSWLQYQLQKTIDNTLPVTGQFGPLTYAAVQKFQASNKLTADGIVGKDTLAALKRYHSGGIAGDSGSLREKELLAVLEKGELILNQRMKRNLAGIIDGARQVLSYIPQINNAASSVPSPAVSGRGVETLAPQFEVNIEYTGDLDNRAAERFAARLVDESMGKLVSRLKMNGHRRYT